MNKRKIGSLLILVWSIIALWAMFYSPPIVQDQAYHTFSDGKNILGIPNFWNVVSNIPFLFVGLWGFSHLKSIRSTKRSTYLVFFFGVAAVSLGSAYYHYHPNDATLVWDRLPMTIAFMALFAIVIEDYVSLLLGRRLLIPLILLGIFSVYFWVVADDLRAYAMVQFYPMVALPIILVFYPSGKPTWPFWLLLISYLIAKVFEYFDFQIFELTGFIGGHPLKHLAVAIGIVFFIHLKRYEPHKKDFN